MPYASGQRGSILMITMWVVLVLAGLVLVFARTMRVEAVASVNYLSTLKTEELTRGAVAFVQARLQEEDDALKLEGEAPYEAIPLGDGYFWLLRPNLDDDDAYYFGIRDEASKLNLNTASEEMLLKLPEMTVELAHAIIDWRDEDSEVSESGAEKEYYLLLDEPYYAKNDYFETVEEVLLVKGANREILFGEDWNRNGVLDDNENDADDSEPPDNRNGSLERGFYDYVTVYSKTPNVDRNGEQRIDITGGDVTEIQDLLLQVMDEGTLLGMMGYLRSLTFKSPLDFYYKLELTPEQFERIEDQIGMSSEEEIDGLININTASKEVLMCLPGLEESDVDALIRKRDDDGTDTDSLLWVAEVLEEEKAVAIGPYIATDSCRYSADIIGVSGDGRSYCRYKMVADTRDGGFEILYWKSLKHLGWPLDGEILTTLRSGETLDE
jgi:type II secretory pathway component PulK